MRLTTLQSISFSLLKYSLFGFLLTLTCSPLRIRSQECLHARVLGAGVSGLTSAIQLQKLGFQVTIHAKASPLRPDADPYYTSPKAGAWWSGTYEDQEKEHDSYLALMGQTVTDPDSSAIVREAFVLYTNPLINYTAELVFKDYVEDFQVLNETFVNNSYGWDGLFGYGFSMKTAMLTAPQYMDWLLDEFFVRGGQLRHEEIDALSDLTEMANTDIVINTPGLGARTLGDVNDSAVYPQRGQIVIARMQGADAIWRARGPVDSTDPGYYGTYILPRGNGEIVLGGTRQDDDYDLEPRDTDHDEILQRVGILWPPIKDATILGDVVGLRPARHGGLRLELDASTFKVPVVHNYGHAGGGFESGPGCAVKVAELVASVFPSRSNCTQAESSASSLRPLHW